jgi:hypothetical protein
MSSNPLKFRNVAAVSAAIIVASMGSALAATSITSAQISDNTIQSADIHNTDENGIGVRVDDTSQAIQNRLADVTDLNSRVANLESYKSELLTGASYTSTWAAHSFGETIETCPDGSYAIGGGYSAWGGFGGQHDGYDLGGQNTDIQVTVSAPYFKGDYEPVDEGGNFRADQWVVRGFNHGDADQIVRAWVVCMKVPDAS